MAKWLKIERCGACPYFTERIDNCICSLTNPFREIIKWREIPDWCPLPNAPEKKEGFKWEEVKQYYEEDGNPWAMEK